jgi:maltose O-acetyltransferase
MVVRPSVNRRSGEAMRSEQEKMLAGKLYHPLDPQPAAERLRARMMFKVLNDTRDDWPAERARLIKA